MSEQLVGSMLDSLDVKSEISEGQQLTEVIVIGKVVVDFTDDESGRAILVIGKSNIDWITQRGLISSAQQVLNESGFIEDDE